MYESKTNELEDENKSGYIKPEMIPLRKFKKVKASRDMHKRNAQWFSDARDQAIKCCNEYQSRIKELEAELKELKTNL